MIIEQINKDNITAMKEHDRVARSILGILKNKELVLRTSPKKIKSGESVSDEEMVALLQKTVKELVAEKENYDKVGNTEESEKITYQIKIVEKYLPEMLSLEKIEEIISTIEDKSIPSVMKYFKANYAGKVDMKDVQTILRKFN